MKAKVIAEIGCNHMGSLEVAREMITTAKIFCKAGYVKFQKRTPMELLSQEEYNAPHPNAAHAYGNSYGEHREFLEFTVEQHKQLKQWCDELGIIYSSSIWDLTAAKEIVQINPLLIKVPSACNRNKQLLQFLCDNFSGEIHVSLGMTTIEEEDEIVSFFEKQHRNKDLILYSCTSGYPVNFEDICLLEIQRLKEKFGGKVNSIGFSGHHLGIAVDVAAYLLGAQWIERHFTLDRTAKGTDHAASLEPDGLRRICRDLLAVDKALTYKSSEILAVEKVQRLKLKQGQMKWER